eukprot:10856259-Lingulodinium_polyedra.AAC.1
MPNLKNVLRTVFSSLAWSPSAVGARPWIFAVPAGVPLTTARATGGQRGRLRAEPVGLQPSGGARLGEGLQ